LKNLKKMDKKCQKWEKPQVATWAEIYRQTAIKAVVTLRFTYENPEKNGHLEMILIVESEKMEFWKGVCDKRGGVFIQMAKKK